MDKNRILRFWSKVDRRGADECWVWMAYINQGGYGVFSPGPKQLQLAHRFSWELAFAKIPYKTLVLHKCDNPACVNPAHLFLGTQTDNMRDCIAKGRFPSRKGSSNGRAKLSYEKVVHIRRYANRTRKTQREIGAKFGISQSYVSYILLGKGWKH